MTSVRSIFISDIHLGTRACQADKLLDFLREQGLVHRLESLNAFVGCTRPDRTHVSFMRSYPNLWPLSAPAVERIGAALEPFDFEVIYGPFFGRDVLVDGKEVVRRSVTRYAASVRGDHYAVQGYGR